MEIQTSQEKHNFIFIEPKIIEKNEEIEWMELFHIVYIAGEPKDLMD